MRLWGAVDVRVVWSFGAAFVVGVLLVGVVVGVRGWIVAVIQGCVQKRQGGVGKSSANYGASAQKSEVDPKPEKLGS